MVALLYLGVALWTYAVVLPNPAGLLPVNPFKPAIHQLTRWDQSIAVAAIARNARAILTAPLQFFAGFQCYPMPRSYTLGEHMFGAGLLAAIPYLLTHDPETQLEASAASRERLHLIGRTDQLALFALTGRTPVSASFAALGGDENTLAPSTTFEVSGARATLELPLVNHTRTTFRQPDPIAPTDLVVRWTDAVGTTVGEENVRALLPLAMPAGGTRTLGVDAALPKTPGVYVVTLAPARTPQLVLARRTIRVTPELVSFRR